MWMSDHPAHDKENADHVLQRFQRLQRIAKQEAGKTVLGLLHIHLDVTLDRKQHILDQFLHRLLRIGQGKSYR